MHENGNWQSFSELTVVIRLNNSLRFSIPSCTSAGRISALHCTGEAWLRRVGSPGTGCFAPTPKRSRWRCRDASTRAWITAEASPKRLLRSLSYATRSTSMWMSMRSSSGPEMRASINPCWPDSDFNIPLLGDDKLLQKR